MTKYRKKPIIIEAMQYIGDTESVEAIRTFVGKELDGNGHSLFIETLEGIHEAKPGDWIIKGIKGEFYPCKPGIFDATYEAVEDKK